MRIWLYLNESLVAIRMGALYFSQELLELLHVLQGGFYLELRVEVDADALGMMEGLDSLGVIGTDATT